MASRNFLKTFRRRGTDAPFDASISIKSDTEIGEPLDAKTKRKRRKTEISHRISTVIQRAESISSIRVSKERENDNIRKEEPKSPKKKSPKPIWPAVQEKPIPITDGDIASDDQENWKKSFHKLIDRYTFYSWGSDSPTPIILPVSQEIQITQVAVGGRHCIALSKSGSVYSWGAGSSGQLGHGDTANNESPQKIEVLEGKCVSSIYSDAAQSAALLKNGNLYCWGWNSCSDPITSPTLVESLVGRKILQVCLSSFHAIALVSIPGTDSGREVFTWGAGSKGQLGHGNLDKQKDPKSIEALKSSNVISISASEAHSACVSDKGQVFIWGSNEERILGVPVDSNIITSPTLVEGMRSVSIRIVQCGLQCTAAISTNGALFTWGKNKYGQLGLGTDLDSVTSTPTQVKHLFGNICTGVTCGNHNMIVWTDSGKTFSCGINRNNRLGYSTDEKCFNVPTPINELNDRIVFNIKLGSRSVVACVGEKVFGVPLTDSIRPGETIPAIMEELISSLESYTDTEGIFRLSASSFEKNQMVTWWNGGYHVDMSEANPHLSATLIKNYFGDLPDPLMPNKSYNDFIAIGKASIDIVHRIEELRKIIKTLPQPNINLLKRFLPLLSKIVDNRKTSLMDYRNLATCFAPTLFRQPEDTTEYPIELFIKLTKKIFKYYKAIFSQNSAEMLTCMAETLVNEHCPKEELKKDQRRLWLVCVRNLNDPTSSFVTNDGTSGSFSKVLFQSELINYSIQSAILCYPNEDSLSIFEQILSLLSDVPITTTINLIEGLNLIELREQERSYISSMLSSFKDIENFNNLTKSSEIDWTSVTLTEYPVDDEELKNQLEETERAALLLRQAEQERKSVSTSQSPQSSSNAMPSVDLFAFITQQRETYKQELEKLKEDKKKSLEDTNDSGDSEQTQLKEAIKSLEDEKNELKEKLESALEKYTAIDEEITRQAKESSIEQQRFKDELEGLDSNIERKEEALKVYQAAVTKFKEFFEGSFASNNQRLMQMKEDVYHTILEQTAECPLLIFKYLEACLQLLSELRKKLKRVKKDVKRIGKTYGDEAAAAIQSEYDKLKDIFVDTTSEMEEASAIYFPILGPVQEWINFCTENNIPPSMQESLVDFIEVKQLNATNIMKEFLTVLLRGFGVFPLPNPPTAEKVGKVVSFEDIVAKQHAIEEVHSAIKRRHSTV